MTCLTVIGMFLLALLMILGLALIGVGTLLGGSV